MGAAMTGYPEPLPVQQSTMPYNSLADGINCGSAAFDPASDFLLVSNEYTLPPELSDASSSPEQGSVQGKFTPSDQDSSPRSETLKVKDPDAISTKSPASKRNPDDNSRIQKRTLNTLAARRYRQKRNDQMSELEAALKEMQAERDAFKVRVARLEGEVDVLRGLLRR